ncbi:ribosomal protein S18-alanine N-acetyltransferase [Vagococcus sp.]|uniref:ribosomal protein S18-alanine N-acetyltransferase n=1 Tax=Vagococcus sp. TaxID=1933889 RepID=UPI003F9597D7
MIVQFNQTLATESFAHQCYLISQSGFKENYGWTEEQFNQHLAEKTVFYFYKEVNEQVVAFAAYQIVLDEAELINLVVHSDFKQQKIGTELLQFSLEFLKKKGCYSLFLEVRKSNLIAQKLYENLGFANLTIRKNYYHAPQEDALIMKLIL